MNKGLLIILTFLMGFSLAMALPSDTTATKEKTIPTPGLKADHKPEKKQKNSASRKGKAELKGFVDLNANGIDDRLEGQNKGKGKKMAHKRGTRKDRFIDRDGDGICDGQESALGLQKLYQRRRKHAGRK